MNLFRNPWALILLLLLVVLLFGANKLPGLARNVGKSMRIFKSEVEELRGDEQKDDEDEDDRPRRQNRTESTASEQRAERPAAREYDPREDQAAAERETVRAPENDDSYRRD